MYHIIIEQTREYEYRMEFDPSKNIFIETENKSLAFARNFPYPYGWIKESGAPPKSHLDIILLSPESYELGDEVPVKIVGCFVRKDGDNKLIGILPDRLETDYFQLPEEEKADLHRLYPRVDEGEGWYGTIRAGEIIDNYFLTTKRY